jgi:serine/threonine protein kinase
MATPATIAVNVEYTELESSLLRPEQALGENAFLRRRVRSSDGRVPQVAKIYHEHSKPHPYQEVIRREHLALSQLLGHPNIVQVFGTIINDEQERRGLILEHIEQPLLPCPEFHYRLRHLIGIAAALAYAHDKKVVYNALDDTTVLVVGATSVHPGDAKLVDFTRSVVLNRTFHVAVDPNDPTLSAMPPYAAPERVPSFKSDVFAFGVLDGDCFAPATKSLRRPPFPRARRFSTVPTLKDLARKHQGDYPPC